MDLRMRLSLYCCLTACVFMVAVPLVSEATYGGRGGEAFRPPRETGTAGWEEPWETEPPVMAPEESVTEAPAPDPTTVTVLDPATGETTEMTLDDYVVCVVAAEMPYTFHPEALKAQAVAARSYCLYKRKNGLTHEGGADVCTSYAHCAAYASEEELVSKYGQNTADRILKKIRAAVADTSGEIITYGGVPALALFHASSWQYTESSENVWGGALPYLVSVSTPEEDRISTVTVTDGELSALFASSSAVPVAVGVGARLISEENGSGRQAYVFYENGRIKAKSLRSLLGLRSCRFEYQRTEEGWLFTVHGHGHGVGMSQYGANAMAIDGADYRSILTHYYTGVTVERLPA